MADPSEIRVRVTPNARQARIVAEADGGFRVYVTVPPEGGKANAAVIQLLSRHLGVPKSRIMLLRGAKSRDKLFGVSD
ncbi:DUF167 domain-containing protein [Qingshengfaniella alkalisoli]|nr:DUF167 domain-containing protein [Qingshengfaniella alkalisoli]